MGNEFIIFKTSLKRWEIIKHSLPFYINCTTGLAEEGNTSLEKYSSLIKGREMIELEHHYFATPNELIDLDIINSL